MGSSSLLSTRSSIALYFSVCIGGKPDSTQGNYDGFLIDADVGSPSFQDFPRLCVLAPPKTTRSHVIRAELLTIAGKEAEYSEGGATSV